MKLLKVVLLSIVIVVTTLSGCATENFIASDDEIVSAINSVRGIDIQGIDILEKMRLGRRLDRVWSTLKAQPTKSKSLIHEALENEPEDDFFIIDLSYLYLSLEQKPSDLDDVSRWVARANPNAYPEGYFKIIASMTANGCGSCKEVTLRMLDLVDLDTYITAHSLPVDMETGLLFTVVPYGEQLLPELTRLLSSQNCDTRANATYVIGMLLPSQVPSELEEMALFDQCERARDNSMRSLAIADPPALFRVIEQRIGGKTQPDQNELLAIIRALELAPPRLALPLLQEFSHSSEELVSEAAKSNLALFTTASSRPTPQLYSANDAQARLDLLDKLKLAKRKYKFEISIAPFEMVSVLQDTDYPLLNEARLSVLRRQSDECLKEFWVYAESCGYIMTKE